MKTSYTHEEILVALRKPLNARRVLKRKGAGGQELSYLATPDVIQKLNEIFGEDGWMDRLLSIEPVNANVGGAMMWRATVSVEARIGDRWIQHADTGIGVARGKSGISPEELEKCIKEAVSDALKRAARKFGDQFGNCLYDKDAPEHQGQSRPEKASVQEIERYNKAVKEARALGLIKKNGDPPEDAEAGANRAALFERLGYVEKWLEKNRPAKAEDSEATDVAENGDGGEDLDEQFQNAVARDEVEVTQ
jgi:DNA recombination protein Rad52